MLVNNVPWTDSLATTIRAGFLRVLPGWGLRGFYVRDFGCVLRWLV